MNKTLTVLLFLFLGLSVFGQRDSLRQQKKAGSFELGINVTSVVGALVGNESGTSTADFPVLLRIHGKKMAFRLSVGAAARNSRFFDPVTLAIRESNLRLYAGKIGFEFKSASYDRFHFYYGIDLIYQLENDELVGNTDVVIQKNINTGGVSPFFGLGLDINDRMRLTTEANLQALYSKSVTREKINPSEGQVILDENELNIELQVPIFVYLNVRF